MHKAVREAQLGFILNLFFWKPLKIPKGINHLLSLCQQHIQENSTCQPITFEACCFNPRRSDPSQKDSSSELIHSSNKKSHLSRQNRSQMTSKFSLHSAGSPLTLSWNHYCTAYYLRHTSDVQLLYIFFHSKYFLEQPMLKIVSRQSVVIAERRKIQKGFIIEYLLRRLLFATILDEYFLCARPCVVQTAP